jgi:hypothetical protein
MSQPSGSCLHTKSAPPFHYRKPLSNSRSRLNSCLLSSSFIGPRPASAVPSPTRGCLAESLAVLPFREKSECHCGHVTTPVLSLALGLRSYVPALMNKASSALPLAISYSILNHRPVYFTHASPTISQEFCQPSVKFFFF